MYDVFRSKCLFLCHLHAQLISFYTSTSLIDDVNLFFFCINLHLKVIFYFNLCPAISRKRGKGLGRLGLGISCSLNRLPKITKLSNESWMYVQEIINPPARECVEVPVSEVSL